jgi:hypothetical protein
MRSYSISEKRLLSNILSHVQYSSRFKVWKRRPECCLVSNFGRKRSAFDCTSLNEEGRNEK